MRDEGWDAVLLHIRRPVGEGDGVICEFELVAYTYSLLEREREGEREGGREVQKSP